MGGKIAAAVAVLLILLALVFPLSTAGQSGITVTGADSVLNTSSVHSSDLVSTTLSITPRVVVEYAHSNEPLALSSDIPASLQGHIDAVSARVAVQYAHSTAPYVLTAIPTTLQTLVDAVLKRVTVEYACSMRGEKLVYPLALMGDIAPPQISDIALVPINGDSVGVEWTTNEFATSAVLYGTQPGTYSQTVSDTLYTKQHEVVLSGLMTDTTYYYIVRSTDRSGNSATSEEQSFAPLGADFTASPTTGFAPLTVVFTNTSTGDYDTSQWDFGDGATGAQTNPTHVYTTPDVYTVTLTISGTSGTDTLVRTNCITVYQPVEAGFTASPRTGEAPLIVQFTDASSGPVATWEWAFGDGATSALQHPTHTYVMTRTYTVSLTARAAGGSAAWPGGTDSLVRKDYIAVRKESIVYLPLTLRNH